MHKQKQLIIFVIEIEIEIKIEIEIDIHISIDFAKDIKWTHNDEVAHCVYLEVSQTSKAKLLKFFSLINKN